MFCPKCGTQNPDTGKFCRSCGTGLENVSEALSGGLPKAPQTYIDHKGRVRSNNPVEIWSGAIRSIMMGVGFFAISMALFFTGVAGGRAWWWAMLFPAVSFLASGISQYVKARKLEQNAAVAIQPQIEGNRASSALPPPQADFHKKPSIYDTGDLVERPPSVTEGTTRHLQIDNEGETMTLPKQRG